MNSRKYILLILALAIFLCIPVPYQSAQAANKDALIAPVVVTINSQPIYETELLYFLIGRNGQDILAELIENAILAQKADFYGATIDPEKPRKEMLKMYGEDKFNELSRSFDVVKILRAVEREHLSEKVYDAMIETLISEKGIEISREKALDYYLQNSDMWSRPAVVRFSIIVAENAEEAKNAHDELTEGGSFADVAAKYSIDEATAGNGGDIGEMIPKGFFRGPLTKLEDAIFELPLSKFSDVISIENNHFIVMPTQRLEKVEKKFKEVSDYIVHLLALEAVDPFVKEKLAEYRDTATIEVIYPIFETNDDAQKNFVKVNKLTQPLHKCLVYPTVVKVNGEEISEQEMLFFLIGRHGQEILQELIENMTISQMAEPLGVEVDRDEPQKMLASTYGEEKIQTLENSFDMDKVRDAIYRELLAKKVFIKKRDLLAEEVGVDVTEDMAKKYYDNNKQRWQIPERVRFSIIVTDTEGDMKSVLSEIQSGAPFADTARKYSIDEVTKDDGGDIGTLWPRGLFVGPFTELEDKIFSLEINDTSKMMFIQDRFYVVKLTEKVAKEEQSFDTVKDDIIESMNNVRVYPMLQEWLTQLGNAIEIDVKYPIFDLETEITMKSMETMSLGD